MWLLSKRRKRVVYVIGKWISVIDAERIDTSAANGLWISGVFFFFKSLFLNISTWEGFNNAL